MIKIADLRLKHCKINGEKSLSYTQFRTRYTKRKEKGLDKEAIEMPNMGKGGHIGREKIRTTVKDQWIAEGKPCPYRTYVRRNKNKGINNKGMHNKRIPNITYYMSKLKTYDLYKLFSV